MIGACNICAKYGDYTHKQVEYCSKCDAYLCEQHQEAYGERLKAGAEKVINGFANVIKEIFRL